MKIVLIISLNFLFKIARDFYLNINTRNKFDKIRSKGIRYFILFFKVLNFSGRFISRFNCIKIFSKRL